MLVQFTESRNNGYAHHSCRADEDCQFVRGADGVAIMAHDKEGAHVCITLSMSELKAMAAMLNIQFNQPSQSRGLVLPLSHPIPNQSPALIPHRDGIS